MTDALGGNFVGGPGSLLGIAEELTSCGYRVFPVRNKKPLVPKFLGEEPFDLETVRSWPWGAASHIGWSLPPWFIGFDADTGVDDGVCVRLGLMDLNALQRELGELPASWRQDTPSGGFHQVFTTVRMFRKLPGKLWNSSGGRCDVDIALSHQRYLVLYDPQSLLQAEFADLPFAWEQYLLQAPHVDIETIAEAAEGTRNITLNTVAFKAAVTDGPSQTLREQLNRAARTSGLPIRESDATITSAFEAAEIRRAPVMAWLEALCADPAVAKKRNRLRIIAAAREIAQLQLRTGKDKIFMSVRELAERVNCQREAARKALKVLCDEGWLLRLQRASLEQASSFRLNLNRSVSSKVTHPETDKRVTQEMTLSDGLLHQILSHDAFRQSRSGDWLTPTLALLLVYLLESGGSCPRRGLATALGKCRAAVIKAIEQLWATGLGWEFDGVVRLTGDPVVNRLDEWAIKAGAKGRKNEIALRHIEERAARERVLRLRSQGGALESGKVSSQ